MWHSLPDVLDSLLTPPKVKSACREAITLDRESSRRSQVDNAWHFLYTGESVLPSPDGRPWNRDYNPYPYPEAKPADVDMYAGTGIGCLYNIDGSQSHLWQLAGWNLVRTNAEVRKRRK